MTTERVALPLTAKINGGFPFEESFDCIARPAVTFNEGRRLVNRNECLPITQVDADKEHTVFNAVFWHVWNEDRQVNSIRHICDPSLVVTNTNAGSGKTFQEYKGLIPPEKSAGAV